MDTFALSLCHSLTVSTGEYLTQYTGYPPHHTLETGNTCLKLSTCSAPLQQCTFQLHPGEEPSHMNSDMECGQTQFARSRGAPMCLKETATVKYPYWQKFLQYVPPTRANMAMAVAPRLHLA